MGKRPGSGYPLKILQKAIHGSRRFVWIEFPVGSMARLRAKRSHIPSPRGLKHNWGSGGHLAPDHESMELS